MPFTLTWPNSGQAGEGSRYQGDKMTNKNKDLANSIAEKLHDWMSEQKYGNEALLHAAVCCDFIGIARFKKRMSEIIEAEIDNKQIHRTQKDASVI